MGFLFHPKNKLECSFRDIYITDYQDQTQDDYVHECMVFLIKKIFSIHIS